MGKWYKIKGISNEMLDSWRKDLREDILVWQKNGEVYARIRLTVFEAFVMRIQMMCWNLNHPSLLKLEKDVA